MKLTRYSSLIYFAALLLLFPSCEQVNPNWEKESANPDFLHRAQKKITDVIVHDIFSPPVASRIYAYSSIAGYEALVPGNSDYQSLERQLKEFQNVPKPESGSSYCYPLASVHAILKVGKALIFSEDQVTELQNEIYAEFAAIQMPQAVYDRSLAFGDTIAAHVLAWADKDNYKQTRSFPKYTITSDPEKWKPTPPDYMDGIEPHWKDIRTFVMDSSQQFVPPPPTKYDMTEGSPFHKEVIEVYETMTEGFDERSPDERLEVAKFWDCNPYVSHHQGHVMFAVKKITPGGHWMGICQLACKKADVDIMESANAYVWTSVALADAFISCWDEKYRSNLVRPETVINTFIDESWLPVLQTPPFPEYTSGHSVISRAAAVALTHIFGDNFAYTDSVEVEFGMAPRKFNSFEEASEEAAISRLYGGIHYRPACDIGVDQGNMVGNFMIENLNTRKEGISMK